MTEAKENPENPLEETRPEIQVRWYHIVATTVVAILAIIAIITLVRRFDLSLIGNETTFQIAATCADGEEKEYHYFGPHDNDYYEISADKKIDRTLNPEKASFQILEISDTGVQIKIKQNGEWKEIHANYATEKSQILSESDDCKLKIDYMFSR